MVSIRYGFTQPIRTWVTNRERVVVELAHAEDGDSDEGSICASPGEWAYNVVHIMLMTQRAHSHGGTGKRKGEVRVPTWEIGSDASSPGMDNQMGEPEGSDPLRELSMGEGGTPDTILGVGGEGMPIGPLKRAINLLDLFSSEVFRTPRSGSRSPKKVEKGVRMFLG